MNLIWVRSLIGAVTFAFFDPMIELIRTNPILNELFGISRFELVIFFILALLIPVLVSLHPKVRKGFLLFWLFLGAAYYSHSFLILLPVAGILFLIGKRTENFIRVFSWAGIVLFSFSMIKYVGLFDHHHQKPGPRIHFPAPVLKANAPRNIFFILLDGTDLTGSYLDQEELPRRDFFPFMHDEFKRSYQWFPRALTNAPETRTSLSVILTGELNFQKSWDKLMEGRDLLALLRHHYKLHNFIYANFYHHACTRQWQNECFPFGDHETKSRSLLVISQMYLYRLTHGLYELPFKLGKEFMLEPEEYKFEEYLDRITDTKGRNFYYLHIFRRDLSELKAFDTDLARLTAKLKDMGLYDDSLIVVTGDHGYDRSQSDHPYGFKAKRTPKLLRIPIAVKVPSGKGESISYEAQSMDLYPTIFAQVFEDKFPSEGINLLGSKSFPERSHYVLCDAGNSKIRSKKLNDSTYSECGDVDVP